MDKAYRATREWIENLMVGDKAPDCFGKVAKVVRIFCRGLNIHGQMYVGYYTEFGGDGGSISSSVTEGEVFSTVALTAKYHQMQLVPRDIITEVRSNNDFQD